MSTDRGIVDSGGRIVGWGSGSVVVKITVIEESMGASADGVAIRVTELTGVETKVLVLVFVVVIDVEDFAAECSRLVTEDAQDVDATTIDPVSSPSSPAAPGSGSELPATFGQSFTTASPDSNIPSNESETGSEPLQAFWTVTVSLLRNPIQLEEHALPLIKSVAVQPARGVLYASVQAWEKPATC